MKLLERFFRWLNPPSIEDWYEEEYPEELTEHEKWLLGDTKDDHMLTGITEDE